MGRVCLVLDRNLNWQSYHWQKDSTILQFSIESRCEATRVRDLTRFPRDFLCLNCVPSNLFFYFAPKAYPKEAKLADRSRQECFTNACDNDSGQMRTLGPISCHHILSPTTHFLRVFFWTDCRLRVRIVPSRVGWRVWTSAWRASPPRRHFPGCRRLLDSKTCPTTTRLGT